MTLGPGIALVTIGLIVALSLEQTIGAVLVIIGIIAVLMSLVTGWGGTRRHVIVEHERPLRRRGVIRERDTF